MKTSDILILAGIGLGAYVLLSRSGGAMAATMTPAQRAALAAQQAGRSGGNMANLVGVGANALSKLFGGGSVPMLGTYDGRSASPWDVTPAGPNGPQYNNPSAWMPDGVVANPPFSSVYDFSNEFWY